MAASNQTQNQMKRPRSPAYYRRQEKRKLERQQAVKANTKVVDASNVEENFKGNSVLENMSVESGAEEVLGVQESSNYKMSMNEMKNGSETVIFSHWSEREVSPVDAVKQIERRLIRGFMDSNIEKADRKYEICSAECTDADNNEIEVKVKLLKNFMKMKQAVKTIETRYSPVDALEITFRGISST